MRGVRFPTLRRRPQLSGQRLVTLGNVAFLVGSVLFLADASQTAGVWCFIVGSSAFLIGGWTR